MGWRSRFLEPISWLLLSGLGACRLSPPSAEDFVLATDTETSNHGTTSGPDATDPERSTETSGASLGTLGSETEGSAGPSTTGTSDDGPGVTLGVDASSGGTTHGTETTETTETTSGETGTNGSDPCGDGSLDPGEACDDGLNDGSYGGCASDCQLAPFCGDGMVNGPEACDDGNADSHDGCLASCEVPTSCAYIHAFDPGAPDGVYVIDADGSGGVGAYGVYCTMTIDGGGWQLVSVRYQDVGVLFEDAVCTSLGADCSGTIPDVQLVPGDAPDLLFATTDGVYWLRVTGLEPPGALALLDVIALDRVLDDTDSCVGDNYCNQNLDVGLMVAGSSPNFVPRFIDLPSQFARVGGIWLGNGGGGSGNHVVSMNYSSYCAPTGLQLSDASTLSIGNVTCAEPGALYFRY